MNEATSGRVHIVALSLVHEWARLILFLWIVAALPTAALSAQPNAQTSLQTGSRVALVIGNGSYNTAPLLNPVNDARAMADSLSRLGFQVALRTNLDLAGMLDAMTKFIRESRPEDVRLFFYAGHGLQVHGRNFLLPVDAKIDSENDIPTVAADVQQLVEHMQRIGTGVNVVILDACRTYPVPAGSRRGTRGVPSTRGLGLAEIVPPGGTIIAFSTAPGSVARDGTAGNSIYTKHLLVNLQTAGLTIEQVFKRVRIGVLAESQQAQTPWENSSLVGDFCFKSGAGGECPGQPSSLAATPDRPAPPR
jgi:uncharacterized caspase-like protein